jgi:hypothetical protein
MHMFGSKALHDERFVTRTIYILPHQCKLIKLPVSTCDIYINRWIKEADNSPGHSQGPAAG